MTCTSLATGCKLEKWSFIILYLLLFFCLEDITVDILRHVNEVIWHKAFPEIRQFLVIVLDRAGKAKQLMTNHKSFYNRRATSRRPKKIYNVKLAV